MSKGIELSRGFVAIVDDSDYEFLNQWKWYARQGKHTWYAARKIMKKMPDGKWKHEKLIHMHRVINNTPDNLVTDHINGNGLDNRRENLRSVTVSGNNLNSKVRRDNKSGYKGVAWHKTRKKWRAYIWHDRKQKHIGLFDTLDEAVKARQEHVL